MQACLIFVGEGGGVNPLPQSKQILRSARAGKRRVGVAFGMVVLVVIRMFNT